MILYTDYKVAIAGRIDAGGTDYFNDSSNFLPSFNTAVSWIVSAITKAFETNKLSVENLEELRVARVFQTSDLSRITIPDYWMIESVNPLPTTKPNSGPDNQLDSNESHLRIDLVHVRSNYSCKRVPKEQWEINASNPFAWGNVLQKCFEMKEGSTKNVLFGYLQGVNYKEVEDEEEVYKVDIEIRPYIPNRLCTIFYVQRPQVLTEDDIEDPDAGVKFHPKLLPLLIEKALYYLSYEQGDGPSIMEVSEKEVAQVTSLLV